jgi:hypothetical protein
VTLRRTSNMAALMKSLIAEKIERSNSTSAPFRHQQRWLDIVAPPLRPLGRCRLRG